MLAEAQKRWVNMITLGRFKGFYWQQYQYNEKWKPANQIIYHYFSRTILPYEFLLDLDPKIDSYHPSREEYSKFLYKIKDKIDSLEIPFLAGFSGRGVHIHIFFDPLQQFPSNWKEYITEYTKQKQSNKLTINDVQKFCKDVKDKLWFSLLKVLGDTDVIKIDRAVVGKSNQLVREFGSQNIRTGYYKTHLENFDIFELIKEPEKVKFPQTLSFWTIPEDVVTKLAESVIKNTELERPLLEGNLNKIKWVENLYKIPTSNGRKRCIGMIFSPYAVNVLGLNDSDSLEWISKWVDLCNKTFLEKHQPLPDSYILSNIRQARNKKYKVLRFSELANYFDDSPEILKFVKEIK